MPNPHFAQLALQDVRSRFYFVDRSPDIGPDRLDFLIFENAVPGGHVVFSARDRINKSVMLIWPQAPQIERPAAAYIVQVFPVAAGAALRVNLGTLRPACVQGPLRRTKSAQRTRRGNRQSQSVVSSIPFLQRCIISRPAPAVDDQAILPVWSANIKVFLYMNESRQFVIRPTPRPHYPQRHLSIKKR